MSEPADLRGLWGFPLTPFRDDRIDEPTFRDGVRHLVAGGARVVIAAGTLGQGDRMSAAERAVALRLVVDEVAGAVPVLGVLVADESLAGAAAHLVRAGAAGALLLPASGDPTDAAAALDLIEDASDGRLPVVLYQRGTLHLTPDDLRRLADRPALVGLKDAHGDLRAFRRLHAALGPRLLWVCAAEDLAAAYVSHGADAVSPASMAYAPAYARRWWAALQGGDVGEAVRLLRAFAWPVTDLRTSRPDIELSVVRELVRAFGHAVGDLRPPASALTGPERAAVGRLAARLADELAVSLPGASLARSPA